MKIHFRLTAAAASIAAMAFSAAALAGGGGGSATVMPDGVILIDQNKAIAGGVTVGDAAGFPVTINQPGTYRLASNLTVPAGSRGIDIASPGVTLDLNGFTISGPVTCGAPGSCNMATTTDHGIQIIGWDARVMNGTVTGFQGNGINTSWGARLENLTVSQNAGNGIYGGTSFQAGGSLVNHVRVFLNRSFGMWMFFATVKDSVAASNGQSGYYLNQSALIDSEANSNAQYGVWIGSMGMLRGVRTYANGAGGAGGNYTSVGGNMNEWTLY